MLLCPLHLQKRGKERGGKGKKKERKSRSPRSRPSAVDTEKKKEEKEKKRKKGKKNMPEVVAADGAMTYFLVMKVSFHFFLIFQR